MINKILVDELLEREVGEKNLGRFGSCMLTIARLQASRHASTYKESKREQKRKERGEIASFSPSYLFIYISLPLSLVNIINHSTIYCTMSTQQGPQARVPLNAIVVG